MTESTQFKHNSENHTKKQNKTTLKQNYPGLIVSYDTWPGNEVGLQTELSHTDNCQKSPAYILPV